MKEFPVLPIAEYRFRYTLSGAITFPRFSGKCWHSVFGVALHDNVCVTGMADCFDCELLHNCEYTRLFRGPLPPNSAIMRKYKTIPVPHVLRTDELDGRNYFEGDEISISITLVGDADNLFESVVRAMHLAGTRGLQPGRVPAALTEVHQSGTNGFCHVVMTGGRFTASSAPEAIPIPPAPEAVRLRIQTPMRLSGLTRSAASREIVTKMIKNLIRRVSLLQYFYTGRLLEADFAGLTKAAESLQAIESQSILNWTEDERSSAAKTEKVFTSGWTGRADIEGNALADLWPYLYLGQWINVGKNASMGYGGYEIYRLS